MLIEDYKRLILMLLILYITICFHEGGHYLASKHEGVQNPQLGFVLGIPHCVNAKITANSANEINNIVFVIALTGIITGLLPILMMLLIKYIKIDFLLTNIDILALFLAYAGGCSGDIYLIWKVITNNIV